MNNPWALIHTRWSLFLIIFKSKRMSARTAEDETGTVEFVPDALKTQEMCEEAAEARSYMLEDVPDDFTSQKMCDTVVMKDSLLLRYVLYWFVTQKQLKIWHEDDQYCNDKLIIRWYNKHKEQKAQKASIKDKLLPIAWHPSRYCDWCMSEDEKKRNTKVMMINIGLFMSDDQIKKFFEREVCLY